MADTKNDSLWLELNSTASQKVIIYKHSIEQIIDNGHSTVTISFSSGEKTTYRISYDEILKLL